VVHRRGVAAQLAAELRERSRNYPTDESTANLGRAIFRGSLLNTRARKQLRAFGLSPADLESVCASVAALFSASRHCVRPQNSLFLSLTAPRQLTRRVALVSSNPGCSPNKRPSKRAGTFDFGVEEIRARNLRSVAEPQTVSVNRTAARAGERGGRGAAHVQDGPGRLCRREVLPQPAERMVPAIPRLTPTARNCEN
jgi:hypothetical protein